MIKAVINRLGFQNKKYTLVKTGSVFKIHKILGKRLESDVLKFSPKVTFVDQKVDSATGAAYFASEEIRG